MRYVIGAEHLFWWPIVVRRPGDAAGELDESELKLQFRALSRTRASEIDAQVRAATDAGAAADLIGTVLREVIVDWEGPVNEEGTPVHFSVPSLEAALDDGWFAAAAWQGYRNAIASGGDSRGN